MLPSQVKNQQTRERGQTVGEGGADWAMGSTAKPEADEHRTPRAGLRGKDKQQDALEDQPDGAAENTDDGGFPPGDESQWG